MKVNSFNQRSFKPSDAKQVDLLKKNLENNINKRDKVKEETSRELLDAFLNNNNSEHITAVARQVEEARKNQPDHKNKVNVIKI